MLNKSNGEQIKCIYRVQLTSGKVLFFEKARAAKRYVRTFPASIAYTSMISTWVTGAVQFSDGLFDGQVE